MFHRLQQVYVSLTDVEIRDCDFMTKFVASIVIQPLIASSVYVIVSLYDYIAI
jgi:hypothetical protein